MSHERIDRLVQPGLANISMIRSQETNCNDGSTFINLGNLGLNGAAPMHLQKSKFEALELDLNTPEREVEEEVGKPANSKVDYIALGLKARKQAGSVRERAFTLDRDIQNYF